MDISSVHKKESIILSTIDIINEFGIQAVSTREVAKRQNIAQGTVFQYFKKKSDLLNAVLDHYSLYDNDIYQTTRLKDLESYDAIRFYIESYMTYYENYPEITAVSQAFDVLRNDPDLGEKVKGIYNRRLEYLKCIVEEAQQAGTISKTLRSEMVADVIFSICHGICLKWRISNFSFSLKDQTMEAVNLLLGSYLIRLTKEV